MKYLFITSLSNPRFTVLAERYSPENEIWTDSGLGDWLGFYDILRDETYLPVGVRLWPFGDAQAILLKFKVSERFKATDNGAAFCILFRESVVWADRNSDDQRFEDFSLFYGPDGEVGILVEVSNLPTSGRGSLACGLNSSG